jgi:hypothetical protein
MLHLNMWKKNSLVNAYIDVKCPSNWAVIMHLSTSRADEVSSLIATCLGHILFKSCKSGSHKLFCCIWFWCYLDQCNFFFLFMWLCPYPYAPSGADNVRGESWQLVTLFWIRVPVWFLVSDTHKVMTASHSCCIGFGFSGTDTTFIFNVLLWSFLYNLIDIVSSLPSMHGCSPWHFSGVAYFRISSCLKRLTIFGGRYLSLIELLIETCY